MAIDKINIGDELEPKVNEIVEEVNNTTIGGLVKMTPTGVTNTVSDQIWHQHQVVINFGNNFERSPAINATVNSPSSFGFSAPTYTGLTSKEVTIYVWRINTNVITIWWSATRI